MTILRIVKSYLKSKTKEKFPLEITYRATAKCNLSCKYCIFPLMRPELTTEEAKRAIKEFADEGTLIWTFTGGEALVRPDIGELINYAKDCGIPFVHLLTNGLLFKYKMKDVKNVDLVTFSLDGPAEVTDALRGKGTFQKVNESIELARREGMDFSITTVVTRLNMENDFAGVRYMFKMANDYDCRIDFQPVHTWNDKPDYFYPTKEEYLTMIEFLKQLTRKSKLLVYSEEAYNNILRSIKNENVKLNCLAGQKFAYLNFDGKLIPTFLNENESVDGKEIGFVQAFYKLKHLHSETCYRFCFPEKDINNKLSMNSVIKYMSLMMRYKVVF